MIRHAGHSPRRAIRSIRHALPLPPSGFRMIIHAGHSPRRAIRSIMHAGQSPHPAIRLIKG